MGLEQGREFGQVKILSPTKHHVKVLLMSKALIVQVLGKDASPFNGFFYTHGVGLAGLQLLCHDPCQRLEATVGWECFQWNLVMELAGISKCLSRPALDQWQFW